MRYARDFRARQPGGRRTLTQQALAILARYGSAANLYLPGVGAINGITAGNWLDSIGMTAAAVDNPTGLVVSAGKTVGPELVANGVFDSGITGWTSRRGSVATHSNGCLRCTNGSGLNSGGADTPIACEIGKTYRMTMRVAAVSAGMSAFFRVGDKPVDTATSADFRVSVQGVGVGIHSGVFVATQTTHYVFAQVNQGLNGSWVEFDDFSVAELPGAHLAQPTTANKPILRQSSWQFDGTNDSFASTMTPGNAGYFCAVSNVTDSGTLRTLIGAGAVTTQDSGVRLSRTPTNTLSLLLGNGVARNSIDVSYPSTPNVVASAGWDASTMFVGVGNTETSGGKTINCTSTNTINLGINTGGSYAFFGNIGATIIMPNVLPTASERAVLRRFIARLSGVAL